MMENLSLELQGKKIDYNNIDELFSILNTTDILLPIGDLDDPKYVTILEQIGSQIYPPRYKYEVPVYSQLVGLEYEENVDSLFEMVFEVFRIHAKEYNSDIMKKILSNDYRSKILTTKIFEKFGEVLSDEEFHRLYNLHEDYFDQFNFIGYGSDSGDYPEGDDTYFDRLDEYKFSLKTWLRIINNYKNNGGVLNKYDNNFTGYIEQKFNYIIQ